MMDFVSLSEAVDSVAKYATDEPEKKSPTEGEGWYSHAEYAEAKIYSDAAATLHMLIHNNEEQNINWFEINEKTRKPLINNTIANEGMEILMHMAGWHARLTKEHLRHINERRLAEAAGIDLSMILPSHELGSGKYSRKGITRVNRIGFNRAELRIFLTRNDVSHSLSNNQPRHGNKTRAQQKIILSAIEELGYDPLALPAADKGKPGVKREVRNLTESRNHDEFNATTSFDSTWKSLKANRKIREAGQ